MTLFDESFFFNLLALLDRTVAQQQERRERERGDEMQQRAADWNQTWAAAVRTQCGYMGRALYYIQRLWFTV